MKQNDYLKVIGDLTNGIFSSILNKQLPNGWIFSVPNEILMDAKGNNYEGIGIQPDIKAPFPEKSETDRGIDPALVQYKAWF